MDEQGASTSAAGGAAASGSGGGGRGEPAKPVKLARPHRCNDRVEDLLQVRRRWFHTCSRLQFVPCAGMCWLPRK